MRGCALPLTQFTYLPSHLCNTIIKINSFPFLHSFPSHHSLTIHNPTTPIPFTSLHAHHQPHDDDEQENFHVLTAVKSDYNDIMIVDTPNSRMLLLDSSHNVHSILYKDQKWTNSYWLIDKARDYFGLSDLEKTTEDGGILNIRIGDVFIPSEDSHRRYAGIVVDLFSDGKVLPQLEEVSTWLELHDRLMANGRLMVNCGGIDEGSSVVDGSTGLDNLSNDEAWLLNSALKALSKAFPGQLSWKRMPKESGENFMALTGPLPDLKSWSANVPSPLSTRVMDWRPCEMVSRS
ncbi:uncharacterized protein [Cicer arietinum]|uniref:Uncharacterized protein LOC101496367 isoform X3 n=1 Tax=Cicer arietinum TaxID=3827 RepID=A0A1S3DVA8_CICAR|nr:uncharacterized protein LOC101496367 isoform X3 [Cicer arietinum]